MDHGRALLATAVFEPVAERHMDRATDLLVQHRVARSTGHGHVSTDAELADATSSVVGVEHGHEQIFADLGARIDDAAVNDPKNDSLDGPPVDVDRDLGRGCEDAVDAVFHRGGPHLAPREVELAGIVLERPPLDDHRDIGAGTNQPNALATTHRADELGVLPPNAVPHGHRILAIHAHHAIEEVLVGAQAHARRLSSRVDGVLGGNPRQFPGRPALTEPHVRLRVGARTRLATQRIYAGIGVGVGRRIDLHEVVEGVVGDYVEGAWGHEGLLRGEIVHHVIDLRQEAACGDSTSTVHLGVDGPHERDAEFAVVDDHQVPRLNAETVANEHFSLLLHSRIHHVVFLLFPPVGCEEDLLYGEESVRARLCSRALP